MSDLFIPGGNPLAKALRGWPSSPRVKPKQFEIDFSNPITRDLIFAVINRGPTDHKDLIANREGSTFAGSTIGPAEYGLAWSGTDGVEYDGWFEITDHPECTVIQLLKLKSAPSSNVQSFSARGSSSANSRFYIYFPSNTNVRHYVGNGFAGGSTAVPTNELVLLATMRDGSRARGFINGEENLPPDNSVAFSSGANDFLAIAGSAGAGATENPDADIYATLIFDRLVSEAEQKALYLDFYQILKPANQTPLLISQEVPAGVVVNPITETLEITTPPVTVQVGLDIDVNPVPELLEITTPQVEVEVLQFINVQPVTANVEIITPLVDVRAFKDTFVDPITATVLITTPQVDVKEGIDLNIDVQTVNLEITTPRVSVTTEVEYLIATEAQPLQYQVSVGGIVQMEAVNSVNAWRNEFGHVSYPFPAVIQDQPEDVAVIAPAPAAFSVTAIGAASYQWYVDDVPQIGETLSTFTIPVTSSGTYAVRCVVLNGNDFGITSKDAILTVT